MQAQIAEDKLTNSRTDLLIENIQSLGKALGLKYTKKRERQPQMDIVTSEPPSIEALVAIHGGKGVVFEGIKDA